MALKSKSVFQDPHLVLACKAALYAALLMIVGREPVLGFGSLLLYFVGTLWLLRVSEKGTLRLTAASAMLILVPLILTRNLLGVDTKFLLSLISGGLFFILVGLKQLLFIRRAEWNYTLRLFLSYLIFVLLFALDTPFYFLPAMFPGFFFLYFLWREFFMSDREDMQSLSPFHVGAPGVIALIALEGVWIAKLLPLSPLNAASLSFLITFVVSDMLVARRMGKLQSRYILRMVTLFALCTLAIFGVSNWGL